MNHIRRWVIYALIGVCFGVIDWYVRETLKAVCPPLGALGIIVGVPVMWGVWLLPALAVAYAELRASRRVALCSLAVALVWVAAIVSYHLFYGFLMAFDEASPLSLGYALGHLSSRGWADWGEITRTLTLGYIMRWGAVALVSGGAVGCAIGAGMGWLGARRIARAAAGS